MTKQSILGKIIFLPLVCLSLFADIEVSIDKPTFFQGDEVTLEIKADGNNIEFEKLKTICGFQIINFRKSEKMIVLNGKPTKINLASYTFMPNKSIIIPAILVKVDGKNYKTKQLKVDKIKPDITTQNDDFQLILATSKKRVYVGEAIVASIVFKHKIGMEILDAKLDPLVSEDFVIKELPNNKVVEKNGYVIFQNNYLLFPQKSGIHTIQNQLINIATREKKTNFMKWKRVFSKQQNIEVLPLPNKIGVFGDFKIQAFADKKETTPNTPVNLTIKIEGFGNINDIPEFTLVLPNEVSYSTKPQIKTILKDGKFGGTFIQKISIIGENSFTIPSFSLQYFDPTKKQIKKTTTSPINIEVNGVLKNTPQIEKSDNKNTFKTNSDLISYLYGLVGFVMGSLFTYIFIRKSKWKKPDTSLVKKIKIAKNDKELYNILIPYSQNNKIKSFIRLLEENIYKGNKQKINKKSLLQSLEEDSEYVC